MSRPTAKQRRFFSKVASIGCMACRQENTFSFPEIHHVKNYGRNDNSKVYGLCPAHHRPTAGVTGIPNRHGNPKEFSEKYGTDSELFAECMNLI